MFTPICEYLLNEVDFFVVCLPSREIIKECVYYTCHRINLIKKNIYIIYDKTEKKTTSRLAPVK